MSPIAVAFVVVNAIALMLLPRRMAPVPLLVGACYMTLGQGIELGPFHFPILRILVGVGFLRVLVRGERPAHGMNRMDWMMVAWAAWALISSGFHRDPGSYLIASLGLAYNACGIYFLIRAFCQSLDDVVEVARFTAFLLVPVAAEMLFEARTDHNLFSYLGGVPETSWIREGRIRASGPFSHPILAGTVGACCFPVFVGLLRVRTGAAVAGLVSCVMMVVTSASSGPAGTLIASIFGLCMWFCRHRMRVLRWLAIACYLALDVVMKAPPYFLLARIDLAGGSTGWHRAELIDSALRHLGEWWLWGTDVTRHWMPTGITWSAEQTDITNHYIQIGIVGGLLLMFLFIATLARGFGFVGESIRTKVSDIERFMVWTLGVSLFAHASAMISVSYFDQSFMFLYLNLASIGSAWASLCLARATQPEVPHRAEDKRAARSPGEWRVGSRRPWAVGPKLTSGNAASRSVR